MSSALPLPQVPDAKPDDLEDVSWALSTAEAMWARGDHADGVKWVRRAAEAAAEADRDVRALELAKAAADLASLLARKSHASVVEVDELTASPPAPPSRRPAGALTRSPIAMPSGAKRATVAAGSSRPVAVFAAHSPAPPSSPGAKAVTIGAAPNETGATPPSSKSPSSSRVAHGKKSSRRSRDNLDAEARAVEAAELAATAPITSPSLPSDTSETAIVRVPNVARRRSRPDVGEQRATAAVASIDGVKRRANAPVAAGSSTSIASRERSGEPTKPPRPTSSKHVHGIVPSQAVRIVVWRDATGVHIAPAGTVVSAITVDAILLALDPETDLTAWLSGGKVRPNR